MMPDTLTGEAHATLAPMPFSPPPERVTIALYLAHQAANDNPTPIPFAELTAEEQRLLTAAAGDYLGRIKAGPTG